MAADWVKKPLMAAPVQTATPTRTTDVEHSKFKAFEVMASHEVMKLRSFRTPLRPHQRAFLLEAAKKNGDLLFGMGITHGDIRRLEENPQYIPRALLSNRVAIYD